MKKAILGSLLAGGLLFAHDTGKVEYNKLSSFERDALESQSPRVHAYKIYKQKRERSRAEEQQVSTDDRQFTRDYTVSDKHTVNAFVPYGK